MTRISSIGAGGQPGAVGQGGGQGTESDAGGEEKKKDEKEKKGKKDPSEKGAAADQRDRMEHRRSTRPVPNIQASGLAGLPMGEDAQPSAAQQIAAVRARLEEAESAFRFMGTGHPSYTATKKQVEQLRAMLKALQGE